MTFNQKIKKNINNLCRFFEESSVVKILFYLVISIIFLSIIGYGYSKLKKPSIKITESFPTEERKILTKPTIPEGRQVYEIEQPENGGPKIIQADINPVDVHVGDTQSLSVYVQSFNKIDWVRADIETDKGIVKLDLNRVIAPTVTLLPRRYFIDKNKELSFLNGSTDKRNVFTKELIAGAESIPTMFYEGSWTVRDTHDTTYKTKFTVRDVFGKTNSITLAWTDACGISNSGNWTSSGNCTISSVDGVDGGSAIISAGNTLTLNAPFAFNPGQAVTVNGAIAIGANGALKKTYLWQVDSDSDNYTASATQYAQDTAPVGGRRRSSLVTAQYDCDDTKSNVYPGVTTSVGSCSCGSYSSTCATSTGGSASTTYCSTNGTYASGSTSCSCSRSTDGISCGTATYGTCSPNSTCSGSGTQSKTTYTCSSGSCSSSSTNVSCSVTPASSGTSCGTTVYGAWGSWGGCSGSGSCPTSGTQTRLRSVTTYACNGSGSCVGSSSNDSQSQSCSIDPTGWQCAPDVVSNCTWPYGTCVNVGDFHTTHYNCNSSGSCVSSIQYGTCLRSTDGTSCGTCNTCMSGSCQPGC